jgi:hypothetical protein
MAEAAQLAKESFDFVLEHGKEIVYDHHIVYQTRAYHHPLFPSPQFFIQWDWI